VGGLVGAAAVGQEGDADALQVELEAPGAAGVVVAGVSEVAMVG
jgi:hypothetical protein